MQGPECYTSQSTMHCTLLVPDLLCPPDPDGMPYHDLHLPALTRLLARAHRSELGVIGPEAWLCDVFGVERQHDWPIAPLTIAIDGVDPGNAYWLRCDPVHLRTQRGKLLLADISAFAPAQDETQALIASFNTHFALENIIFQAPHPARWYLRTEQSPELTTQTFADAVGQDIHRLLPAGADSMRWHGMLNEIQMLLHDHPVNRARDAADRPAINSVWLWGGGVKPVARNRPFEKAWSDDALTLALAGASEIPASPLPANAMELIKAAAGGARRQLVVLPELRDAALSGNAGHWRATLSGLEERWFKPLCAALRRRRLTGVALVMPGGQYCRRYDIKSGDLWKFWRSAPEPGHHA